MAYAPPLGTVVFDDGTGVCSNDCEHRECTEIGMIADAPCENCGQAIGWERNWCLTRTGYVHHACTTRKG